MSSDCPFVFSSTKHVPIETDEAKEVACFSMFSGCCSSQKIVELCHGLLVLFDGPAPAPDKVHEVSRVIRADSNMNLADCVSGTVWFSPAETVALGLKIEADLDRQFRDNASKKRRQPMMHHTHTALPFRTAVSLKLKCKMRH